MYKRQLAFLRDPDAQQSLEMLLQMHVVPAALPAAALTHGQTLPTLLGFELQVSVVDGVTRIAAPAGGTVATVVEADVAACGVTVHVVDAVLLPGEGAMPVATDSDASAGAQLLSASAVPVHAV